MSIAKKTVACLTATAVTAGVCAPAASAASFTVSNGQCNFSHSWNDDSMWRRAQNLTDTNAELPKTLSKLGTQGMVEVFATVVSDTKRGYAHLGTRNEDRVQQVRVSGKLQRCRGQPAQPRCTEHRGH